MIRSGIAVIFIFFIAFGVHCQVNSVKDNQQKFSEDISPYGDTVRLKSAMAIVPPSNDL